MADGALGPDDALWMRRALDLAVRGWGRVAPNPMVGCVIVRDGNVVGEGWHTEYGEPHAEVEALRAAGDAARGATAYVTLEPCSHFGKTPPCTDALIAPGVSRVVYAAADPNPKAAGGASVLRDAGIEVTGGVEEQAARDVNAVFFHAHGNYARPFIALKLALTLDSRIADRDRRSVWITGEEARAEVHRLRAGFDAIGVGIGTAEADDPQLTVRGPLQPRKPPIRVVFDRHLMLQPDSYLARTAAQVPVIDFCEFVPTGGRLNAMDDAGVIVLPGDGLTDWLWMLRQEGARSLLVEGGAGLAGSLLDAEVVDRLYIFYAPVLLGPQGLDAFGRIGSPAIHEAHRWRRLDTQAFGADTLITLARE
ncbi:MAG TPA: bifunctional diaminohydroxyphosphoribosylaminopyrimidine deaminase/5-amino-6-(5-phosphoribosylamino)uracil reductase RibD [Longimicrobiaceae bacterium]|nr:bifunctional diaminohydroxyphosphoribosylaminopyrimidine deaminase/5-amino-6-(5-phosphoribosylamino)uracil reductase RibD [Longimicrobiaceae bacterium]